MEMLTLPYLKTVKLQLYKSIESDSIDFIDLDSLKKEEKREGRSPPFSSVKDVQSRRNAVYIKVNQSSVVVLRLPLSTPAPARLLPAVTPLILSLVKFRLMIEFM